MKHTFVFHNLRVIALVLALVLGSAVQQPVSAQVQPETSSQPGDWLSQAQETIRQSEYQISWVEEPLIPGAPPSFQAPNRAQDLRFYFQEQGVQVIQRTEAEPSWVWGVALVGVGDASNLAAPLAPALTVDANQITYQRGDLLESYANTEQGLVQTFSLNSRPTLQTGSPLALALHLSGDLTPRRQANGELAFHHAGQPALHYGSLRASDAEGRSLTLQAAVLANAEAGAPTVILQLVVEDQDASYPVEIRAMISGLPTTAHWWDLGDQTNARLGYSVATAGDVNGDGYSDVIIGVPDYDNTGIVDTGKALVYHGSPSGLGFIPNWSWTGTRAYDRLGAAVATAGDVNNDGYSDVIIGAPGWDNGVSELDEGLVRVFYGSGSGLSLVVNWDFESNQANAKLGSAVASAGNVNGDDYSDVIFSADSYKSGNPLVSKGRAWVVHGSGSGLAATPAWFLDGVAENDWLGYAVGTAGDVNGDTFADVLISAPGRSTGSFTDNGVVYIHYGSPSGLNYANVTELTGGESYEFMGVSVSTAGEINGDGYSDVIIGSPERSLTDYGYGLARVYHGASYGLNTSLAWYVYGNESYGKLGWSVATAGDVNGDGYGDVIIGQKGYSGSGSNQGRALLWLGGSGGLGPIPDTISNADWQTSIPFNGAEYGYSVATAGDVNGDGYSDVIVGAPYYSGSYTEEGIAYVYHGGPNNLSSTSGWSYTSDYVDTELGFSAASAGDINGDGYADIIVGAPKYDSSYANEGAIFVWTGSMSGPSWSFWFGRGNSPNAQLGYSVDSAGDVNGDGYDDIIAGAPYFNNGSLEEGMAFVWLGSASGMGSTGEPSNADWKAESNTFSAALGTSVAGAGDVNGDGYADVAVGVPYYSWYNTNEGRAMVWHGSSEGLGPDGNFSNADWVYEMNMDNLYMGMSIAGAGDVNRDGYSDLIAGGVDWAFAWYGSQTGLSTLWTGWSYSLSGHFGASVSTAGDVNGDGYSDVVIGAPWYTGSAGSNEGVAIAFCGSAGGIGYSSCWADSGGAENARFGSSVATAGDVNGDGYADILVGAPTYSNTEVEKGSARLYYGSSTGLVSYSGGDWRIDSTSTYTKLGASVASAGDINGDGYADVLIGAPGASSNRGQVQLFYGNGAPGKPVRPRPIQLDYSPLAHLGLADSKSFMVQVFSFSPTGAGNCKLQLEIKTLQNPFNASGLLTTPAWWYTGLNGNVINYSYTPLEYGKQHHWRVRFKYSPVSNLFAPPYSRWYHMPWNGWNEADLRGAFYKVYIPLTKK